MDPFELVLMASFIYDIDELLDKIISTINEAKTKAKEEKRPLSKDDCFLAEMYMVMYLTKSSGKDPHDIIGQMRKAHIVNKIVNPSKQ
jgi:hypothetical protein